MIIPKIHTAFYAFFFLLFTTLGNAQEINGKIVDSKSSEPLPLVNITYNKTSRKGTTTNFDGKFNIPSYQEIGTEITISYIGYETLVIPKNKVPTNGKAWQIKLKQSSSALDEIDLVAKENPALRIVRNAINNRQVNNPKNYESYTYLSYNKDVVTFKAIDYGDTLSTKDSIRNIKDLKAAESRHLLVFESVTKKYFKAPGKSIEKVIGSKISGFKDPTMGTVPEGFQNFGFYDNTISLLGEHYLNPISQNGDKKYIFILKDSTFANGDTTFIMDYLPDLGSNFDGFNGQIHINSNGWAIEYIYAFPNDTGKVNISLEQRYQLIDGKHWFPSQLNFNYVLEKFPFRETGALMSGKSFIDSVQLNIPINDSVFTELRVDFVEGAGSKSEEFWDDHRAEALDSKETKTYTHLDSLGERYNFDGILYATHNLYNGFLSFKKFDVQFNKLASFNSYEGWRLGLGLFTNKYLSKDFRVGGYFGYGFRDKGWKYGGTAQFFFKQNIDNNLEISYKRDLRAPGEIDVRYWRLVGGFTTQFLSTIMDNHEEVSVYFNWRFQKYFESKVGFRNFKLNANYDYIFAPIAEGRDPRNVTYGFAESYARLRWAHKEKFKNNYGQRISEGSDYPVFFASWAHGFSGTGWGEFDYNKIEFGVTWEHYFSGLGKTDITLEGGFIDKSIPIALNFSGRPSYRPGFSIVLVKTFQTMRFNEFSSSTYGALFFSHNLQHLLFKNGFFKPQVILKHAMTFGYLRNSENHQGFDDILFKPLNHGYYESGVVLHELVRLNTFNFGYIGLGTGIFYRYGPNQFKEERMNWAFKFAMTYSIN